MSDSEQSPPKKVNNAELSDSESDGESTVVKVTPQQTPNKSELQETPQMIQTEDGTTPFFGTPSDTPAKDIESPIIEESNLEKVVFETPVKTVEPEPQEPEPEVLTPIKSEPTPQVVTSVEPSTVTDMEHSKKSQKKIASTKVKLEKSLLHTPLPVTPADNC